MPIFDVTTPDGKVMEVNAPEGATAEDAIAFIASTYVPEKPPKQNTSNLGDIATAFKQGVVGAGKSITDIAGADNPLSEYLGGVQTKLGKEYRPQRIEEMQKRQQLIDEAAKSGSTLEEIKAYLGGVAEAPIQSVAQAAGSFAPYVVAGGAGAAARAAGIASKALPSARAINTGLGAIQGTGAIKGSIYENVKAELEAKGVSPEIAAEKASQAQAYSIENAPQLGLGAVLGAAAGRYGAENLVTPGIANRLNANLIPRALTAATAEAIPEGAQSGQEQYATNVALQREGIDRDPMQGVIGSAVRDAAIGALTAAPIGAISRGQIEPPKPVLEPTKAQEPTELDKQSDPKIYNEEVRQSAPQIAEALLPEMKRFGLENVGLKIMDSIENGRADGMWANNLIHVALDKPNPMGSMRHESVHALKQLGGFQDKEWSALSNKAKSEWLQTFIKDTGKYEEYKKIYQQENKTLKGFEDYIHEEAIAEAFRYFDKNGAPEGMIGAIYEKLKLMFEALRNGFTGAGFQSADSIFRSIESGTREQVAAPTETAKGVKFSTSKKDNIEQIKFADQEIQDLVKNVGTRIAGMKSNETLDDVRNAVAKLQQYTSEGIKGKDWYEKSAAAVLSAFKGDPILAEKFFQLIAITSANTEVSANFTKAVNAWNQFTEGKPIKVGTENENKKVDALLNFGEDWGGRKTNTFYSNLMEAMEGKDSGRSTIDLHMTRMIFGKDVPTDAQYELAEKMVGLLAKKAGMIPRQVQAASWVTQKAKSMFDLYRQKGWKKNLSDAELRALTFEKAVGDYSHLMKARTEALPVTEALKEPSPSIKARTQNITGEIIPSVQTPMGQAEEMAFKFKEKITKQIANSDAIPKLIDALGIKSKVKVTVGSGAYASKVNPNLIVKVINDNSEEAQRDALDLANAMSYVFKQDATPLYRADPKLLGSNQLGHKIKFDTADITPTQQKKMLAILQQRFGEDAGFTKINNTELVTINYRGEDGNPFLTSDEEFMKGLAEIQDELSKISPIESQEMFGAQSEYPYHDWKDEPSGAGIITRLQDNPRDRSNLQQQLDNLSESFVSDLRETVRESGATPKFSITAPDTKEFKQWFGDSKIVNPDGKPKVYYHGTAQDIIEFRPKQANAIFLTDNPKFAKDFSQLSKHYMEQDAFNSASQEEKVAQLQSVRKLLEEDGRDTDLIAKDIRKLKKGEKLPSDFYIAGGYSDLLDYVNRDNAGAENILPVFVKASNPFDYQNIKDIEKVLNVATPEEMQPVLQRASYNPDRLKRIIGEGSWNTIESPQFQSAVRRAGFDGFYVSEGGNKNLAVYDSSQIKSFTNQAPTESKDIRFSVALNKLEPDTFLTSDKNPNALGNLGFMPTNSPFPKRPIRLQIGTRGNEKGKAYGAKHILERGLTDVAHRPVAVTKEALEDTILHIESLSKRFNRVYQDGSAFILYDSQTDDAMVVTPMNGFYGVTTMYSNPNVQRRYGNPKWSGRNVQPPVEETGLKVKGISVRANEEGDIVQPDVPKAFKQAKVTTPNQIDEQAQNLPRKTGTLGIKKKLSLAPNAPPQGTFTTLIPNETAGKRLTDAINNVVKFFKDPEERIKTRIAFVDPNSGLARSLKDSPIYDANGVLRADLLARGKAQTINIIQNGLQTGIPIINSDGSVIIQRDDVNNLANSQAIADRLNDNKYVKDSDLSGRGYVAEVARALRGKEIMAEDAAFNKTQKNVKNHVNREKQIKPEQIAWAEQQMKNVPELQEIFDIWKNVNTGLLNLWEEVGLLDKKQADEYRSKKYYVSLAASNADLEEMMENQLGYTASGVKSTPKIHKLKGSETLERNIWENIDKQYASMLAGAYQNQVRKIAVEQLIGAGAASIPSRVKNGKTVGAPLTDGINLRYKDPTNPLADNKGVVHVIVDNPVDLAAFESFHYELSPLMKFFGGATNVLRAGALINPMFWIRQLIRDPIHAALVANSGITTPFHSAKEFINVLANNSPEARILAERGVIGQYDSTMDLHSYLEQTGREQLPKGNLNKLFHKLMQIHEASDASTRIAIFKKEKEAGMKKGMTEEQAINFAVMKARESINFMIHGNSSTLNALRQMIPFLSASITSLDTVYRAATGYNLPPTEKAAAQKLFKQRAALMFGSSIAYAMLMQDDDEYKKLPDYIKDNNWLIKNPTGEGFIKVAVPYEVGFLFKTLPEVAIRGLAGNATGKEMLKSYKDGFLHNLPTGGVPVPQAIKPALEVITNYSFFTGNPIESIGESRLPVEMRGRNSSETAKFLSQSGLGKIGLSPAKIDALAQGYLAEAGTFSFSLADQLITTVQGKEPTSKNLAKQPFFKAFLTDENSNKAVADFYEIEQTANQVAQEFSTMTKTGLGKEAVELMQDEDKRKLMASAPALRRVATSMTSIRKAIEATNNNQSIPPDERRDMVNKLTAQYNRVAEQGVKLANTLGVR